MNIKLDNIFFLAFFVLGGIAIIIGTLWVITTEKRLKRFFLGKKAKDLEETITILENEITDLKKSKENINKDIIVINEKLKKSIR